MFRDPTKQPTILKNLTCPYCGVELDESNRSKDHVIARKFVPTARLQARWNLIVFACQRCNNEKSKLEDDLSPISMQLTLSKDELDEVAASDARRKAAGSISRRTGKPVADSDEVLTIAGSLGPSGRWTATFNSPPQADNSRIYSLARLHFLAFFYRLTFDDVKKRGYPPPPTSVFLPINVAVRSDWGNSLQIGFMVLTRSWWTRLVAVTADGYFRVAIRKCPDRSVWSCALEWNENMRVIALVGEDTVLREIAASLPPLKLEVIGQHDRGVWRARPEVALADDSDTMFDEGDAEPGAREVPSG